MKFFVFMHFQCVFNNANNSTTRPCFTKHYYTKSFWIENNSFLRKFLLDENFYAIDETRAAICYDYLSVNWDETHASPHFKLVSTNFNAFVHCSSELNWILTEEKTHSFN